MQIAVVTGASRDVGRGAAIASAPDQLRLKNAAVRIPIRLGLGFRDLLPKQLDVRLRLRRAYAGTAVGPVPLRPDLRFIPERRPNIHGHTGCEPMEGSLPSLFQSE
jgi:hypothetical protein